MPVYPTLRVIYEHWWTSECHDQWYAWVSVAPGQVWEWAYRGRSADFYAPAWQLIVIHAVEGERIEVRGTRGHREVVAVTRDDLLDMARPTWVPWPHPDIG